MEEKKIVSKEVQMKPTTGRGQALDQNDSLIEELQKWDKDRLIQQVIQMNQQLYNQDNYMNRLRNQINEMNQFISNKRMEYLFKIVETANQFDRSGCKYDFDPDFVSDCISEIQEALVIPKEEKDDRTNKEN